MNIHDPDNHLDKLGMFCIIEWMAGHGLKLVKRPDGEYEIVKPATPAQFNQAHDSIRMEDY